MPSLCIVYSADEQETEDIHAKVDNLLQTLLLFFSFFFTFSFYISLGLSAMMTQHEWVMWAHSFPYSLSCMFLCDMRALDP